MHYIIWTHQIWSSSISSNFLINTPLSQRLIQIGREKERRSSWKDKNWYDIDGWWGGEGREGKEGLFSSASVIGINCMPSIVQRKWRITALVNKEGLDQKFDQNFTFKASNPWHFWKLYPLDMLCSLVSVLSGANLSREKILLAIYV